MPSTFPSGRKSAVVVANTYAFHPTCSARSPSGRPLSVTLSRRQEATPSGSWRGRSTSRSSLTAASTGAIASSPVAERSHALRRRASGASGDHDPRSRPPS
jgi:hypothetical protein